MDSISFPLLRLKCSFDAALKYYSYEWKNATMFFKVAI
jgi:hypothetical protein